MTPCEVIAEELDRFTLSPETRAKGVVAALRAAGYVIRPADDPQAIDEAVKLLSDNLREMAPITAENHRKRVAEFVARHRSDPRVATDA